MVNFYSTYGFLRLEINYNSPCIVISFSTTFFVTQFYTFAVAQRLDLLIHIAMLPEWHMVVKYVVGCSRGLMALWDPRWASTKAFIFFGGILLAGLFHGFSHIIHLINVYAPYLDILS